MTHLVEMQRSLPQFEAAGIKLYAVSYDEPEALADFAKHHGIEYPLLSDHDSRVIREYGILNTQIPEHQVPFYGVPFPGTYVTDEEGRVVAKFFPRQIAMRESAETFIDSALGHILIGEGDVQAAGGDEDIRINVAFRGGAGSFRLGLQRRVVVRFELPEGLHIYGPPVPEGMVATSVEISGPKDLRVEAPVLPPTKTLHLDDLDIDLQVWSGTVDIVVPVWAGDELAPLKDGGGPRQVGIDVSVRYQACDSRSCRIPQSETFRLQVPVEPATLPRLPIFRGYQPSSTMPTIKHLQRMIRRGLSRNPWTALRSIGYLIWQARALRVGSRNAPKNADGP